MDVIEISGSRYVKASVAAKKKGYTSDYVGQLCRAGKVDAKQVGRAWYVREDSLDTHKDTNVRSNKQKTLESVEKTLEQQDVARGQIHQTMYAPRSSAFRDRLLAAHISYETDPDPLLPQLAKSAATDTGEALEELAAEHAQFQQPVHLEIDVEKRPTHKVPVTIDEVQSEVRLAVQDELEDLAVEKPWSATIDLTDTTSDEIVFRPAPPSEPLSEGEIPVTFLDDDEEEEVVQVSDMKPLEPSPHVLSPFMGLEEEFQVSRQPAERAVAARPIMSLVTVTTAVLGLLLVVGSIFLQNVWVYEVGAGSLAERPYFETSYGITAVSTIVEAISR